jgi:glyoxylase-like metal-dependent hydrolase (beta-lactamase superfamily II)
MFINDLELHLLCDGIIQSDAGGPFGLVPRALYQDAYPPDGANLIPMVLNCLLVRSEGKTILIDTGLGDKWDQAGLARWHLQRWKGGLLAGLQRLGIGPESVDLVINTHLHADHCSGNTRLHDSELAATFPGAEYWVQRIEWAEASQPDSRTRATYLADNFAPLMAQGRLRLLHGDTPVTKHVRLVVTPGHTRAHQSVVLESGDWKGLFVADMASYAIHMARTAWLTAYDVLPLENIRTKQRWQQWCLENAAWLFFQHDPGMPVARLEASDGRFKLVPAGEGEPLISDLPRLPLPGG